MTTTNTLSLNLAALRHGLSPLAAEALGAALELGQAGSPLTLWLWAMWKATDERCQPADRRAAARELANKIAATALGMSAWAVEVQP
jgi:hypothetical protein